jgi:8-oxo-dGTP pyrophosphatase MutT (NUDIX family)
MAKFIRKAKREVYRNPWLTFEVHDIVHPNGAPGEHGLVVPPLASGVVVVDGDEVLLTRQERFAVDRSVLEVVKGGADEGESALECAQRETREELGVVARVWEPMGIIYEVPSILGGPIHLFLAREIELLPQEMERVESIGIERLPFAGVLDAIAQGRINDAVTGTALFRAAVRLGFATLAPAASSSQSRDVRADRARD